MRSVCLFLFAAVAVALTGSGRVCAQQPIDPFDAQLESPRKSPPLPVKLPDALPKAPPKAEPELGITTQKILQFVTLTASVEPIKAKRGEVVGVIVRGNTKPWAYTYSAVERHKTQSGVSSKIDYKDAPWLKPLFPIVEKGKTTAVADDETQYILHGEFEWKQDVYIAPDAPVGSHTFVIQPFIQVCTKENEEQKLGKSCFPPASYKAMRVTLDVLDGPPLAPPADLDKRLKQAQLDPPSPAITTGRPPVRENRFNDLSTLLLAAFAGAVLMLLTPCVFPMIPITVNFFIKQSEKEHHRPFLMASVYAGTIIVLLSVVIMLAGKSVIDLANDAWFNLGLGVVLVVFALGLFGMFDVGLMMFLGTVLFIAIGYGISLVAKLAIPVLATGHYEFGLAVASLILAVPVALGLAHLLRFVENLLGFEESAILSFFAKQESRGGMIGAAFMAMTFTITSFSCTGPFLGILLAPLAGTNLPKLHLLAGALVYATTFAAPFFLLALFPTYLKKLPRSGGWMTTIKVTMGFLEIGAALKFLSNTDLFWFPGNPRIFNYDTVLCSWIALSFACSLYLFGVFRLHHDTPEDHIGVPRMIFASLFLGMALYLTPLLFGRLPQGVVMEGVVSFLPPDFKGHDSIAWVKHDYEAAWKQAVAENKLIFVDFTGVNCVNCRENERNVFPRTKVADELKKYVCVKLYTDIVPDPDLSTTQAKSQAETNLAQQYELIHEISQPSYVILDPNKVRPFDGKQIDASVVGVRTGKIYDVAGFEKFLQQSLKGRTAIGQKPGWNNKFEDARSEALRTKKLMFIEFFGVNDVNSLVNEAILNEKPITNQLAEFVRVNLAIDVVLGPDGQVAKELAEAHRNLQVQMTKSVASPMYVVYDPEADQLLRRGPSTFGVRGVKEGKIDIDAFVRFLRQSRIGC